MNFSQSQTYKMYVQYLINRQDWRSVGYPLCPSHPQHLLGTSVLAFLLLPLALSCETTKTKKVIFDDYKHIIFKQLENINLSIERELKNKSCENKQIPVTNQNLTQLIYTLSCKRLAKLVDGWLENELTRLVAHINASLGCPCTKREATHADRRSKSPSVKRKLCRLKHLIARIMEAYAQYNSA